MRLTKLIAACTALMLGTATLMSVPAAAQQNLFAPRLLIDGKAITQYEFQQRRRFLQLLNAPGNLDQEAEKTLIEDRLRLIAAERMGLRPTDAQIREGMTEFASRAGMTADEFVAALEQNGVAGQTFRDFVRAGIVWRDVVRARFGAFAAVVSEADIDRSLSLPAQREVMRVLLSEIVLPPDARDLAQELAGRLRGEGAFGAAAREYSTAPSAAQGGRLDWVPVANLSQAVVQGLTGLQAGQVTPPIPVAGGIALYLFRALDEQSTVTPANTELDYIRFLIPGAGTPAAAAEVERIRARATACTDLYLFARDLPEDRLQRETRVQTALPADLAPHLAVLDPGEISTAVVQGDWQVLLMLCSRSVRTEIEPDRDTVGERIALDRLSGHAEIYLEELRANAHIRRP